MTGLGQPTATGVTGLAVPPAAPGLGIDWDYAAVDRTAVARATLGSDSTFRRTQVSGGTD